MSRDGRQVAAAGFIANPPNSIRDVRVWDVAGGNCLFEAGPRAFPIRYVHGAVALSPDGALVAFDDYTDADPGSSARIQVA